MKCPIKISNICLKREGFPYSKNMAPLAGEKINLKILEDARNTLAVS